MPEIPKLDKVKYLHSKSLEDLQSKVQAKVRAGYELLGSVVFLKEEFIQVMYKRKVK